MRGYPGACARLHGHNYRVELTVAGDDLDERGMLVDFAELKSLCDGVIADLDHRNLNDLPAFAERNPSSENLARYLYERIAQGLPGSVRIRSVRVYESSGSWVTYRGDG
jgi:6-pyruvoyltetrahydropterin/6-carboxytetrahydropterin synthase